MSIGKIIVQDFCDKHRACSEGKEWAIKTGAANMSELWNRADMRNDWRLWIFSRSGVDKKTAIRFAVFCARQNWHLLTDDRSKNAIVTVERWLDGKATREDVYAAGDAARAAWAVATDAARAALDASDARAAARAAASDAAWDAQNEWLINNVKL